MDGTLIMLSNTEMDVLQAWADGEIAPVIHAHKDVATSKSGLTMFYECSNCRKAIDYSDVYCKYCGAKMDEVPND